MKKINPNYIVYFWRMTVNEQFNVKLIILNIMRDNISNYLV